jgi:hypothetical protein
MTSTTFSPCENDAYVGPHITGPGYVSAVLSDGTIRTEAVGFDMSPITVDGFLRGQQRAHVTRMLRQMSEELGIVDLVFPRPIMERIAARAVIRRAGRSRRGYRGAHHRGTYTVADLERYVAADADAVRAYHRRSLRRRTDAVSSC